MYALLVFVSLVLIVAGSHVVLSVLGHVEDWRQRRLLQMLVLAAPAVSLGVGVIGLHHFTGCVCLMSTPAWDYTLSLAGPIGMGVVALGAVGLGLLRVGLMFWVVGHRCVAADRGLQALANRLAEEMGTSRPRVLLYASNQPVAVTWSLRCPTILLSTWMVDLLDARELESVLAHELGHAARHDCPVLWLATVLRDAFFYLPTSRVSYRQLQTDREIVCDELAASVTQRPLALASALAKVWHEAVGGPAFGIVQALVGTRECIEERIERLMEGAWRNAVDPPGSDQRARTFGIATSALVGLMIVQAPALTAMLVNPIACSSASLW